MVRFHKFFCYKKNGNFPAGRQANFARRRHRDSRLPRRRSAGRQPNFARRRPWPAVTRRHPPSPAIARRRPPCRSTACAPCASGRMPHGGERGRNPPGGVGDRRLPAATLLRCARPRRSAMRCEPAGLQTFARPAWAHGKASGRLGRCGTSACPEARVAALCGPALGRERGVIVRRDHCLGWRGLLTMGERLRISDVE